MFKLTKKEKRKENNKTIFFQNATKTKKIKS